MNEWIVDSSESGLRLIDFIKKKNPLISNKKIKQSIDRSGCKVNGHIERFSNVTLSLGDRIFFAESDKLIFEKTRVLYEDSSLLIYNKPPYISSVEDSGTGIDSLLRRYYPGLLAVHRLDKETSGVLLFAKTPSASQKLLSLFKQQQIEKNYLAIVEGIPPNKAGIIENRMSAIEKKLGFIKWAVTPKGLPAKTEWKIVKESKQCSLINCQPKTGRTHQIRVHLSWIGHPILGDFRYACPSSDIHHIPSRIMLHAHSLDFIHPITAKRITTTAPLPDDFSALLANLP